MIDWKTNVSITIFTIEIKIEIRIIIQVSSCSTFWENDKLKIIYKIGENPGYTGTKELLVSSQNH